MAMFMLCSLLIALSNIATAAPVTLDNDLSISSFNLTAIQNLTSLTSLNADCYNDQAQQAPTSACQAAVNKMPATRDVGEFTTFIQNPWILPQHFIDDNQNCLIFVDLDNAFRREYNTWAAVKAATQKIVSNCNHRTTGFTGGTDTAGTGSKIDIVVHASPLEASSQDTGTFSVFAQ